MTGDDFVDYYELLELSTNAKFETIERVFRYMAKRMHPDLVDSVEADEKQFKLLIEAYETLRSPELRTGYDLLWEEQRQNREEVIRAGNTAESDCTERLRILQIFYGQRRREMRQPGVSIGRIEDITGCPAEVLSFHLWYFREKGWIDREESGLLSITALGVDQIEAHYNSSEAEVRLITHLSNNEEGVIRV